MKYSEPMESCTTAVQRQDFLTGGEQTAITLRVANLNDAAAKAVELHGVSFLAFIRNCIINELAQTR